MTDFQLITIAFFTIGLLAFFFGEPFAIKLLLGVVALIWITDQPDKALAAVQAGLAWALWVVLGRVIDAAYRLYRVRAWRRMVTEIDQARADFRRAGLDFDYEMAQASRRHQAKEQMYRQVGLGNQSDRINYFSEKGDY